MEELDYTNKSKQIYADYITSQKTLDIEFGLSKAKYKEGDVVRDSVRTILVDRITTFKGLNNSLPEPVYHGIALKKDLTPKKSGDRKSIYGNRNTELIITNY